MRSRAIVTVAFLFAAQPLSAVALASSGTTPAKATSATNIAPPLVPIFRILPKSPLPKLSGVQKSIVKACFTVTADGSTTDARVTSIKFILKGKTPPPELKAQRALEKATLKAFLLWKFFPRRINSEPVATPNVCQAMVFKSTGYGTSDAASAEKTPNVYTIYPPIPVKQVMPSYPRLAENEGIQADVSTCFTVEADGSVIDVRAAEIHYIWRGSMLTPSLKVQLEFEKSAIDASRMWRFSPRRINSKSVATSDICQAFRFRLK